MGKPIKIIMKGIFLSLILIVSFSCKRANLSMDYNFDNIPDRIWVGEDFWTVPIEDWAVKGGRVECKSFAQNSHMSVLSYIFNEGQGNFELSWDMGLLEKGKDPGSSGIVIGAEALEEKDIRSAIYFGRGLQLGVNTEGFTFLDQQTKSLPENFSYDDFRIEVSGTGGTGPYTITMKVSDNSGNAVTELSVQQESGIQGIIKLVNNMQGSKVSNNGPRFWFDNISLSGDKFTFTPENRFGPILWTMYTQSENILKLSAQLPPLGEADNKNVDLQVMENGKWQTAATVVMHPDARTATFRLENWDSSKEIPYRVTHEFVNSSGKVELTSYDGIIQKDPVDRPLRLGALTCQHAAGFPYSPLVKNLGLSKPDLLYFSGDQIYESNGGYTIKREPEDMAILSYLGKWYMFGWAFGDLMRNVPTIATPDDHDVFQGNIWGEGGANFTQTIKFINTVNETHCSHLPDPFDPIPTEYNMSVWYTIMKYGKVSFAIISDRVFKSKPERVTHWEGRPDHIVAPLKDPSSIEKPELVMLGERQEDFLNHWIRDWKDVNMKVLLTQTLFANVATHHGSYNGYLYGDMDSGGWPKMARDRALQIIRKAYVYNIAGDQHLPSLTHYGIDNFRDAGWCYVTPAISVGYTRWFRPDDLNIPVSNRPVHGFPNTGEYTDAFGNKNFVYAIGNAIDFKPVPNRFELAQAKTSGYGMILFDQESRDITAESWRFLADMSNPGPDDQHPGWPFTVNQFDNYGREAKAWLPTLKINGKPDPVVEIINKNTGETEYIVRIKGNEFVPKVFSEDMFSVRIGYPETEQWKILEDISTTKNKGESELSIDF